MLSRYLAALRALFVSWRYRAWLTHLPDALLVLDQQGRVRFASERAARLSVCSASQMRGGHIGRWLQEPGEDYTLLWQTLFLAGRGDASGSLGWHVWHAEDGSHSEVALTATAIPADRSVLLLLRLRQEQHPDQPQHYLARRLLPDRTRATGIGSWVLCYATARLQWSPTVHRIFGTDPRHFHPTEGRYFQCVHPDDRARVRAEIDRGTQHARAFDIEYRVVRPDGKVRHILERNHVHHNAQGQVDYMWGTIIDMTGDKQLERQLQLSQLAVEHGSEGIAIADAAMNWLYANPALQRMCAAATDGTAPGLRFMPSPGGGELSPQELGGMLHGDGSWRGELYLGRPHAAPLAVQASVSSVHGYDGQRYAVWVLTDISQLKEAERRLRSLAFFDSLTGLANRTRLQEQLQQALTLAERKGHCLAIAFFDLDGFKQINDCLGHDAGDLVLCEVASQLRAACRDGDSAARWGGDEFALLLPDGGDLPALYRYLQCLPRVVQVWRESGAQSLLVGASVGVALYPYAGRSVEQLLLHADQAMYRAKAQGEACLWLHDAQGLRALPPATMTPA